MDKSVFEGIKGTDESYVYEGTWGESEPYTISFKGADITTPMDFNAAISSVASHQMEIDAAADAAEYIVFLHAGAFPGKAAATITVSLPDGVYLCYRYDDTAGKFKEVSEVTVKNGMVSFSLNVGGEYFITSAAVDTEGHTFDTGDTINGSVPSSVFEDAMGKDVDLTFEGTLESGIAYEIVFNGADITDPMDFETRISEQSVNAGSIGELAKDPLILSFYHQGAMPGKAKVKLFTTLEENKTYGLYYYNNGEEQGEYIGAVLREEDGLSFEIDHCGDYFITPYQGKAVLTSSVGSRRLIVAVLAFELLLVLAAAGAVIYRRLGKDGIKEKISGLPGRFSLKKKKNDGEETEAPFESDPEETEDLLFETSAEEETASDPAADRSDAESFDTDSADEETFEQSDESAESSSVEIDHASFMRPEE